MADSRRDNSSDNEPDRLPSIALSPASSVPNYADRLNRDPRWALSEGSRHFEEGSAVFTALHKITARLGSLGISYAVVGGMALFRHGVRRFTEDVDLLVTKPDLKVIHEKLDGLGYLPPFKNSKNLRDTELGVKIEFITTGDFPGDGKQKPVSFPDPLSSSFESEGIRYLDLPKLVELKLASGMTSPGRLKDLSDVLELIKLLNLPVEFANRLNPYVRDKFEELRQQATKRYVAIWNPNENSAIDALRVEHESAERLEEMRKEGVILEELGDGRTRLVTTDPNLAEKYGMVEESEFWDPDQKDEPDQ